MKKLLTLLTLMILFTAGEVSAQTTDEYKEKLKEMFMLLHLRDHYQIGIDQIMAMNKKQYPDIPEEIWEEFEEDVKDSAWSYLMNELTSVYADYYTLSDVEELIKFYKSPTGKKMIEHTNSIMQESMEKGKTLGAKLKEELKYKFKQYGYKQHGN